MRKIHLTVWKVDGIHIVDRCEIHIVELVPLRLLPPGLRTIGAHGPGAIEKIFQVGAAHKLFLALWGNVQPCRHCAVAASYVHLDLGHLCQTFKSLLIGTNIAQVKCNTPGKQRGRQQQNYGPGTVPG